MKALEGKLAQPAQRMAMILASQEETAAWLQQLQAKIDATDRQIAHGNGKIEEQQADLQEGLNQRNAVMTDLREQADQEATLPPEAVDAMMDI